MIYRPGQPTRAPISPARNPGGEGPEGAGGKELPRSGLAVTPPAPDEPKMRVTGASIQEVGTPPEFLRAVEAKLGGRIFVDLAANASNHVADIWIGPGHPSDANRDAFKVVWHKWKGLLLWLNPPFADIGEWARRCAAEAGFGAHVAMLMPAAIGTNYFREWVWPYARIYALSPRLTFVGHTQSYPKDLIVAEYGPGVTPGFECWRWKA